MVDGSIMLNWVLKKENEWAWNGLIWFRIGRGDVFLWDGNKLQRYKKK
jgi:hypothetical protein